MTVLGYCLMSNHVHLLAVPLQERSLAQTLGQTHFRYTLTFGRATEDKTGIKNERNIPVL